MSFVDKMKKVGKSMVETGTRTMLKVSHLKKIGVIFCD